MEAIIAAVAGSLLVLMGPWLYKVWRRRRSALTPVQRDILVAAAESGEIVVGHHDGGPLIQAGLSTFDSSDLGEIEGLVGRGYLARRSFRGVDETFHLTERGIVVAKKLLAQPPDKRV